MDEEHKSIEDLVQLLDHTSEKLRTTEQWLAEATGRIRVFFENIPFGLLITNADGKIEVVNRMCIKMFSCDVSSLIGRQISDFFIGMNGRDLGEHEIAREVTAVRADGAQFPAEIVVRQFSTSAAPQLLITVEDITPRFEVERMKREFVSMVSHDLRTPLSSIQCFLNTICDGIYDGQTSGLKDKARLVENDTARLLTMINNLLDIDRLEAGKLEMFADIVSCADIVENAVASVASMAEQKNVTIELDVFDRQTYVLADAELAVQVLVNLLSNAIKFSPSGERVHVRAEADAEKVKFRVSDRGPGIPEEFRKRMFNRFEQARISDARIKGG